MSAPPLRFGAALRAVLIFSLLAALTILVREVSRREVLGDPARIPPGSQEACLACHDLEEGPGGPHGLAAIGCESCHLGDPLAFEENRAHRGLEKEPGALATVDRSCGRSGCHPKLARSVQGALMARGTGLVSVDRFVFGEQESPDGDTDLAEVLTATEVSPADDHLRRLCGGCHLGSRRENRDDAVGLGADIGSGCGACHSRREPAAAGAPGAAPGPGATNQPLPVSPPRPHSRLLPIPDDDQCLGCHSRSGRISLSYRGLSEVLPGQTPPCPEEERELLPDGRITCHQEADVHHAKGLACVDCHLAPELMGDGHEHGHQEQAVQVGCEDCHPPADQTSALSLPLSAITDPTLRQVLDRRDPPLDPGLRVRLSERGFPLWNLREDEEGLQLLGKLDGRLHPSPPTPADPAHRLRGHERLVCASCHARWTPTCPTCHTHREEAGKQWDFAHAAERPGVWVERSEGAFARPPSLGLRRGAEGPGEIVPVLPGMIMDLRLPREAGGETLRHRLFAPLDPHTTGKSRSCESCHLDPLALGLGSGRIRFEAEGPVLLPKEPGAPDAWTTLSAESPGAGTRVQLKSLDGPTLRRSLRVGLCLGCHPGADPIHADLPSALERLRRGTRCEQPRHPWLFETAEPVVSGNGTLHR